MKKLEIQKLKELLEQGKIPFNYNEKDMTGGTFEWFGGSGIRKQIEYPSSENRVCSVIFGKGTYGYEEGLLEIMGLLTEKELERDEVVGHLTAEEVFKRIRKHFFKTKK